MELTTCPECGHAAEILFRETFPSTDGPVEHAKVLCIDKHWFLLPTEMLMAPTAPSRPALAWAPRGSNPEPAD